MWSDTVIDTLIRQGVSYFIISPGSRSTPLTLAAARHPDATTVIAYDERGAAYHAVGYARATARPAVLICTSGTAAANYLPAVTEASNDALPLIALTADRPPEQHNVGANQTMDQQNLYGGFVRTFINLPPQDPSRPDSTPRDAVLTALDSSLGPVPGPVHINCMFREPFELTAPDASDNAQHPTANAQHPTGKQECPLPDLAAVASAIAQAERGMIVAGALATPAEQDAVAVLAEALGWPLWADIRSGLHNRAPFTAQTAALRDLLLSPGPDAVRGPDCILHVGGNVVSKPLLDYFTTTYSGSYLKLPGTTQPVDPTGRCSLVVAGDVPTLCSELMAPAASLTPSALVGDGTHALQALQARLEVVAQPDAALSEPAIGYWLAQHLSDAVGLVLGNSMPVRFVDRFAVHQQLPARVVANRGVSGIDGTIATAVGYAAGLGRPVVCLLGDLTLMHDMSSLTQLSDAPHPIIFIVVNNRGGGIFHHLPVAEATDVFEPFFTTPHAYTFEALARQFALAYRIVETNGAFVEALQAAIAGGEHALLELSVDQAANMAVYHAMAGRHE
ncbi:MAG: 2-succinyl-5-enolpyruvyl-6-hydroxy-3-cyclohexene-1-carboxylic-acid synthase [Verrucomicrobia bacterium]|jgi:2-succinyl-5-enolpyruvyl-6-hydroxy-3-cyclohexene-1-carboxylate synthase|nr:2-succinyl-5-enolpyruvyl-6-hydroxy-3-cyclohexene-1-carboxylic-acid synthase [Verrucomicrobiota bacterium]